VGWLWRAIAFVVTALRFPILLAWIAAAVAATVYLPPIATSGNIDALIPKGAPAIRAEVDATRLFGVPLSAQVAVVQRNPRGFASAQLVTAGLRAAAVDEGHAAPVAGLAGALPVSNVGRVIPGSRERSTTIITFLFFRPGTSIAAQTAGGQEYARRYLARPQDHLAGVTGPAPAQDAQGVIIQRYLPWIELATVLAIALIVGLYFRSVGAPLATLLCSGIAYLVAVRVIAWVGQRAGVTVPPDLEPVLVVLLLGVTTDYAVFYLAGMRARLEEGLGRVQAARRATAETTPIIVTAGLVVAAGVASLVAARLEALRAFGPGLALTVLIAMVVAVTLAPALIAIFGSLLFRPGPARLRRALAARKRATAPSRPVQQGSDSAPPARCGQVTGPARDWRASAVRLATTRPVALLITAACVAGLVIAALGLTQVRLGFPLIRGLPDTAPAARAEAAAAQGFVPGILAPTEVLVLGPGAGGQRAALTRLQHALARQPGVAGVVGPADVPAVQQRAHLMLARSGDAARYAVIQRTDPLGATAISRVRELRRELPAMARTAGLTGVRVEVAGGTALAGEAIDSAVSDLGRIALVIGLVIVILLACFLRALLAPLYLLGASVLALLSALGLTVWIFQNALGYDSLVYYVPFVVAVLLISLGSDYNVFVVGRIWEGARRRPLRDAVAVAAPRASRAITTAGLALAAGFGVLALVPLDQFRELAVAMVLGIVIDTFVVRSLLVPALVVLFGRAGSWPARLITREPARARQPDRMAVG
jgi:RND superfamily putative drug exporter